MATGKKTVATPPAKPSLKKPLKTAPADSLRLALQDVVHRSPKHVTIEFHKPARGVVDEADPWSGNIYKYSF
jgi:hypothetical protein